jgi:cobyrinic acid a,c-diamide synthase
MISGTNSGVGKTTAVVAIARALNEQGLKVRCFKCGPDYLDPTYHFLGSGQKSVNLDTWIMGKEAVLRAFTKACQGFDFALIEGVMGLFDGADPLKEVGSSAEMAKLLKCPVVLVTDVSGMARTIKAFVKGFSEFDSGLNLVGLIANKVGSESHLNLLRKALGDFPLLGAFRKQNQESFPERHLGLKTASKETIEERKIEFWKNEATKFFDWELLIKLAKTNEEIEFPKHKNILKKINKVKIGLAFDDAFHFYYDENLAILESLGAELIRFSPLKDDSLPDVDGLIIGGGYPEVFGDQLAGNRKMREAIQNFAHLKKPIYAECGGLMYLCESIIDQEDQEFEMVGLFNAKAKMGHKLKALGYVEVEVRENSILGPAGTRFRGHQFRYSDLNENRELTKFYNVRRRRDRFCFSEGLSELNILASYVHAHWASNEKIPANFIESCRKYRGPNCEN